jgi:hypothetical protein
MLTFVIGNRVHLQAPRKTAMGTTWTAKIYCDECRVSTRRVFTNGQPGDCPHHETEVNLLSEPPENHRSLYSYN